jgi:lysophospholipase L1-like esterase
MAHKTPRSRRTKPADVTERTSAVPPRLGLWQRALALAAPSMLLLALAAAAELGLRWTTPHLDGLDVFVRSNEQQHDFTDRNHVRIFEGDPLLFWRLKPNLHNAIWDFTVVSTNAQGLRHDRALGRKAAGSLRIVCLGDSVTFGYRVPVVFPDHPEAWDTDARPYPMLIERRLRAANPGREIEVVTLAVPGYTSQQGLAWLQREIAALDPDLVTLCFGWNDVNMRPAADAVTMPMDGWSTGCRALVSRSQILLRATRWLHGLRSASASIALTARVSKDDYVRNVLAAQRLAERHGAAALIIGPVYRDTVTNPPEAERLARYREALRLAAQGERLAYLEIAELTERSFPENRALFGELIHPDSIGHALMAERILQAFDEQGLLRHLGLRPPAAQPLRVETGA